MTRADALALACGLWLAAGVAAAGPHVWTLLPPVAAYALLVADGIVRPAAPWLLPLLTHGDRGAPRIALTFDDGPDPEVTPRVLDLLHRHGVRATFFLIAERAQSNPDLVRRMAAEGHEIANHSYRHSRLLNLAPPGPMRREILRATRTLNSLAPGATADLYRPPMGLKSPWLAWVQRQLQLRVATWSLHARDTSRRPPEQIARRVLRRVRGGDIVVMHDGHDRPGRHRTAAAEALPLILQGLLRAGLHPVPLGELCPPPCSAPPPLVDRSGG